MGHHAPRRCRALQTPRAGRDRYDDRPPPVDLNMRLLGHLANQLARALIPGCTKENTTLTFGVAMRRTGPGEPIYPWRESSFSETSPQPIQTGAPHASAHPHKSDRQRTVPRLQDTAGRPFPPSASNARFPPSAFRSPFIRPQAPVGTRPSSRSPPPPRACRLGSRSRRPSRCRRSPRRCASSWRVPPSRATRCRRSPRRS